MNRIGFAPGIGLLIVSVHQIVGANGRISTSRANFFRPVEFQKFSKKTINRCRESDLDSDNTVKSARVASRFGGKTAMNARLLSACLAIAFTAVALLALTGLHVVSPEFDPAKRVVSEYTLGRHGWLLSVLFL